jgi:hypothetical protein
MLLQNVKTPRTSSDGRALRGPAMGRRAGAATARAPAPPNSSSPRQDWPLSARQRRTQTLAEAAPGSRRLTKHRSADYAHDKEAARRPFHEKKMERLSGRAPAKQRDASKRQPMLRVKSMDDGALVKSCPQQAASSTRASLTSLTLCVRAAGLWDTNDTNKMIQQSEAVVTPPAEPLDSPGAAASRKS